MMTGLTTNHMNPPTIGQPAPRGARSSTRVAARTQAATRVYGRGNTAVTALDSITIDFEQSKFTAIMGPSGSGKSTLMYCIAGLDQLTSGESYIGDTNLASLGERELTRLRRDHVGFVFQAFNLVPTLTAQENIELPMTLAGVRPDAAWVDQVVGAVGLGDRMDHRPNELSGGQQQRVAVARALAGRPEIIFADEPTGNLDSTTGQAILHFLRRAVDELGQTIVMVTHDATAASFADRVIYLADGRIAGETTDPTVDVIHDELRTLTGGN